MAPKRSAREPTPSSTSTTHLPSTTTGSVALSSKASLKANSNQSAQQIAVGIWQDYVDTTPQRTKLIDVFMAFLVAVGVLQFVYCVIVGNYVSYCAPIYLGFSLTTKPFNAFLSGFSATVGQFVLTGIASACNSSKRDMLTCCIASLRIQTNGINKAEFISVSPERYGPPFFSSTNPDSYPELLQTTFLGA
jgi:oligosaccharyltransferase complex subunit epsilon